MRFVDATPSGSPCGNRAVRPTNRIRSPTAVRSPLALPATRRDRAAGTAYQFGLFIDQQIAGEVNLNNVVRGAMQSGTIGYWIDQRHAGHAYVAEAVAVVLQFGFEQLALHRLEICIVPRNERSKRVMQKLGDPRRRRRTALPRDQRRLGGPHPLRHHHRGVDRHDATTSSAAWIHRPHDLV